MAISMVVRRGILVGGVVQHSISKERERQAERSRAPSPAQEIPVARQCRQSDDQHEFRGRGGQVEGRDSLHLPGVRPQERNPHGPRKHVEHDDREVTDGAEQ